MARVCLSERWSFCEYHGKVSHDARSKAIADFGNPKKNIQIMLASLRAGGLGLNLTMASRVLVIDPWWNEAVEQQAFGRVFRFGQQRPTAMTRLVVKNSIDESLMEMKARKKEEIDGVITESTRGAAPDVNELLRLFGDNDEDGHPFIFAQAADDEGPEHLRLLNNDRDDEDQAMDNEA